MYSGGVKNRKRKDTRRQSKDVQPSPNLGLGYHHRIRREQKKLLVKGFVCQENSDNGTGLSEFGDNQVPHQCVRKGQQGIKPLLPPLSFRQNFPSLRLGEMLAQNLNGYHEGVIKMFTEII